MPRVFCKDDCHRAVALFVDLVRAWRDGRTAEAAQCRRLLEDMGVLVAMPERQEAVSGR